MGSVAEENSRKPHYSGGPIRGNPAKWRMIGQIIAPERPSAMPDATIAGGFSQPARN